MRYLHVLQLSALAAACIKALAVDYYEVLGLKRTATHQDIRNSYKNLARECHPDKDHSPEAQEKFLAISEAHEVLSDEEAKKDYDNSLRYSQRERDFGYGGRKAFEMNADLDPLFAALRKAQARAREQSKNGAGKSRQRTYSYTVNFNNGGLNFKSGGGGGYGTEDDFTFEAHEALRPVFMMFLAQAALLFMLPLICCVGVPIWICCYCYKALRFPRQQRRPP